MEDVPARKIMTVEEAKFYPTPDREPPPLDPGELPKSYGKNRLVLLPIDPYLLYAYWELAADPPPTAGARAVLRFHETPGRPFDVEIDLAAGNWYVHLWSAGKSYEADLGVRSEDGALNVLAHSNTVSTPPAAPVPRVSAPPVSAPAPLPEREPEPPVSDAVRPVSTAAPQPTVARPSAAEASRTETPAVKAPARRASSTKRGRVPDLALLDARVIELLALRGELPPLPGSYNGAEFRLFEQEDEVVVEETEELEEAERQLELEQEEQELEAAPAEPAPFDLGNLVTMDLTQYSEQRFTPGVSSEGGKLGQ
jgi:hypothetical protein